MVTLPAAPSTARVELDPDALRGSATVRVRVRSESTDEILSGAGFCVWIEDERTALPLAQWSERWRASAPPQDGFIVPAGRLRIAAAGIPEFMGMHGEIAARRTFGRSETTIDVAAGDVRDVELVLGGGGRLEVDVRGELGPADEAALAEHRAQFEELSLTLLFEEPGQFLGARLSIEAADRNLQLPVVRIGAAMMNSTAAGDHHLHFWPLGETRTSEVLPVGVYTLRATQRTRSPIERTVTISEGETTRVVLNFGH